MDVSRIQKRTAGDAARADSPNQMTTLADAQSAKRNGKPFQLSPDLSIIAWITFGPIMEDARFDSPKRPKNCRPALITLRHIRFYESGGRPTMLSKPGGVSSAIMVWENA